MANFNLNKVILGGRLTAEPEIKTTPSGVAVTSFNLAVQRRYGGGDGQKPPSDFITVVAWRQTAEFITRYFHKGSCICIAGAIQSRTWTDQSGAKRYATEVVADEAYFVESKSDGGAAGQAAPPPAPAATPPAPAAPAATPPGGYYGGAADNDDDLPF